LLLHLPECSHSAIVVSSSKVSMEYVSLGKAGIKVSRLCLGCMSYGLPGYQPWALDENDARNHIRQALDLGFNFFDTADVYSYGRSEEILGRALKDARIPREHVVIATKVFFPLGSDPNQRGLSRKHIREAIDASLSRLGVDYVDLYQVHRFDCDVHIDETLEALDQVVRSGKALYLGSSSMYTWQFATMLHRARELGLHSFVSMQNHYNLIYREEEREMLPFCRYEGVAVIPWSPLARGFLTGNRSGQNGGETTRAQTDKFAHRMYYDDSDFAVVSRVTEIAAARGISNAQVALSWLLHQPGVTSVIVGASKLHHLTEAAAALNLPLSDNDMAALAECYRPHTVLGHGYGDPLGVQAAQAGHAITGRSLSGSFN
jgi:aryl-alcohol dehydrogenase-like predicted oxidoreductase